MASYIFPGTEEFELIQEAARTPNAREVAFGGLIWKRRKDGKRSYFEAVDTAPIRNEDLSFLTTSMLAAYEEQKSL